MYPIADVTGWDSLQVSASGRRPKAWLFDPDLRVFAMFKRPYNHAAESAVEKIAAEVGRLSGIPTAVTQLAIRDGVLGVLSYRFVADDENLIDGGAILLGRNPAFDMKKGHSFQAVRGGIDVGLLPAFIELLVLDAVVGNSDRHPNNWSIIRHATRPDKLAPSYDHGSSLGRELTNEGPDNLSLYVDRGRAKVGWQTGGRVVFHRHLRLLRLIAQDHELAVKQAVAKAVSVPSDAVSDVVNSVPDAVAITSRRVCMIDILALRRKRLAEAFKV
jgi:hypothetical protein